MKAFRRSLFNMPELEQFKNGVPGLLSPTGFDLAYTQYQSLMLEKLDYFVAGTCQWFEIIQLNIFQREEVLYSAS